MHDLRARRLRTWIFNGAGRPIVSTAMVHEGEGAAEERFVLGDTVPAATLREAADRPDADRPTDGLDRLGRARLYAAPLPPALGAGAVIVSTSIRDLDALLRDARNAAVVAVLVALLLSVLPDISWHAKAGSP